jgi:hypothetical protein
MAIGVVKLTIFSQDYMKPDASSNSPFFTQSTYEKSTCNCLRDFASQCHVNNSSTTSFKFNERVYQ